MASSGNIAVFNPLSKVGTITFSEGNTIAKHANSKENTRHGTTFNIPNTGKWYFECKFVNCNTDGSQSVMFTLHDVATEPVFSSKNFLTQAGNFISFYNWQNRIYISNSFIAYTSNIATQSSGIVSCAIDRDNSHMWVAVNNTWINGTPNFSDGTNKVASPSASLEYGLAWSGDGGGSSQFWTANFGTDSTFAGTETAQGNQDSNGNGDFYYAPPTDFLALSSANLPISNDIDPAQTDDDYPAKQFAPILYTGNGSTQALTGLGFKPDLVWLKSRSNTKSNALFDSSRGVTKYLSSDATSAETTDTSTLTAFGADGFSLASPAANNLVNGNGFTYVGWCWKANGGTTSTNSEGSLDSTVQANTKAGFSIVTTPNFSSNCTQGHGLTKAPEFVIHKLTASGNNWNVWHTGLSGAGNIIRLNTNAAETTGSHFNSTAPTADVFSLGASLAGSGAGICYLWHSVPGYSSFGKYVANGNADGPFIYTGFRPRLLVIKAITSAPNNWMVFDTARETFNPIDKNLHWDTGDIEETSTDRQLNILSNGFKLRSDNGTLNHPSGDEYIYMCWGDVSFKYNNTF